MSEQLCPKVSRESTLQLYKGRITCYCIAMSEEKLPVDENTLSKSVAILKKVLSGNLDKPQTIELLESQAHIEEIPATLDLKLEPVIHKKQVPGKQMQGEIVHSEAELQMAVDKCMESIKTNPQTQMQVKALLLQREDKGFGSQGDSIDLKSYSKNFVLHQECQTCHKQGIIMCSLCQGRKQVPCQTCRGQRQTPCMTCRGQRTIKTPQGKVENCRDCMGKGTINCRNCKAAGSIPCTGCKQTGKIKCDRCNATGHFSLLEHVDFKLKTSFHLNPSALPFEISEYISENRKIALKKNEIHVTENNLSSNTDFNIKYTITLPYGSLKFKVGDDKEINGTLFGYEGSIRDTENFLEKDFCNKEIKNYLAYAKGRSSLLSFKKSLKQSRLLKDILIQSAIKNKKTAYQFLTTSYPIGIRPELIKSLIIKSDKALRRITIKKRLLGLVLGLIGTTTLFIAYYLGPIREIIEPHLPNYWTKLIADLIILILGGTLSTYIIHIFSKNAVKKFLKPFLNPGDTIQLLPKTGKSAYFGYLVGLIMYGLTIYFMPYAQKDPPLWVIDLLLKLPI